MRRVLADPMAATYPVSHPECLSLRHEAARRKRSLTARVRARVRNAATNACHNYLTARVSAALAVLGYCFRMGDGSRAFAQSGWAKFATEFIPATHRDLPMLRLYLPFLDPTHEEGRDTVRWSRYVDVEEEPASLDWFEAVGAIVGEQPAVRELVSCMGELDESTADALRDAIGDIALRGLRWVGYGETPFDAATTCVFGAEYFEADVGSEDVRSGRRVPDFAWDAAGRLAWGSRLYPDSLIIAAELPIFRQLRNDPRVDSVSVRPDRDVLPRSAGD